MEKLNKILYYPEILNYKKDVLNDNFEFVYEDRAKAEQELKILLNSYKDEKYGVSGSVRTIIVLE
jgi:hypothetical protein